VHAEPEHDVKPWVERTGAVGLMSRPEVAEMSIFDIS